MADATKAAKDKADELGVDLDAIDGSGKDGRITVGDVEEAASQNSAPESESLPYVGQEPLATADDITPKSDLGAGYEATHGGPPEATDRNELWREAQESGHDDVSPTGDFIDGPDAAPESA